MKLNEQSNQSLSDFIAPLKIALDRYWRVAWPPAVVFLLLGLLLSIVLSPYYTSNAIITNQQQRLNSKLAVTSSKDEQIERLEALKLEVVSRPRLSNILDQYPVYPKYKSARLKEVALKKLKNALDLSPYEGTSAGQKLAQTFKLSFSHSDPEIAFKVTKAISDLFIDESMLNTKIETEGTVEFLDTRLREARQKLEATEKTVRDFQKQNFGKLPDDFQSADVRLKSAQAQLANNSQMIIAKTEKLNFLKKEIQLVASEVPSGGNTENITDPEAGLAQLESALIVLRSKYSDEHPDVIATKKRIEALRARLGKGTGTKGGGTVGRGGAEARSVRREMGDIEAELVALNQENKSLKDAIVELENNIKEMPIKGQDLIKIKRDYENTRETYDKLLAARQEADFQKDLVSSQKGEQFKIVDPPTMPTEPDGPPRLIIAIVSVILSILLFFGISFGCYFSNSAFKTKDEIESELGIPVLGVVPPIATINSSLRKQKATNKSILLSFFALIVGVILILILS